MTFEQWMETLTSAQWHNVCEVARANTKTKLKSEQVDEISFKYYAEIADELHSRYLTHVINP